MKKLFLPLISLLFIISSCRIKENENHTVDFLDDEDMDEFNYYIGTLNV